MEVVVAKGRRSDLIHREGETLDRGKLSNRKVNRINREISGTRSGFGDGRKDTTTKRKGKKVGGAGGSLSSALGKGRKGRPPNLTSSHCHKRVKRKEQGGERGWRWNGGCGN